MKTKLHYITIALIIIALGFAAVNQGGPDRIEGGYRETQMVAGR